MMTASLDHSPGVAPTPGSARVRLAQLSRDVALRVPGVAGMDSGPTGLFVTVGDRQRVDGVRCVAAGDGAYDVSLRLRCEMVALPELGEAVRTAVRRAATLAESALAEVNVLIADIAMPDRG